MSTRNLDGTANLAPMSSAWALGYSVVLGLGTDGHTYANLVRERECVLNLPSPALWRHVERLAPLTGADPVPEVKRDAFRHHAAKFEAAGLTPQCADVVDVPRVRECPIQLEAVVAAVHPGAGDDTVAIVETHVERVHVAHDLVKPGTDHVIAERWTPLLYVFRHYVGADSHLGKTFRAAE